VEEKKRTGGVLKMIIESIKGNKHPDEKILVVTTRPQERISYDDYLKMTTFLFNNEEILCPCGMGCEMLLRRILCQANFIRKRYGRKELDLVERNYQGEFFENE
jgi:hypothetical protein